MSIQKNIIKNILKVLTLFISMFGFNQVFGYTTVSGTINTNTTWTTGNTYYISAATILASGNTLTIEPGAIIKVNNGVTLTINGIINVNGVSGNNVYFTGKNDDTVGEVITGSSGTPARGNWSGISISGAGTNGSIIDYTTVRYAITGVSLATTNIIVRNSLIEEISGNGMYFNSTSGPTIENSTIRNTSGTALYVYTGNPIINNNLIQNIPNSGIFTNLSGSNPTITGNVIENTNIGIYLTAGTATISGNTIQNNTQYGINSYNLDIRLQPSDVMATNTITGNTLGQVASRGNDITPVSGTIDGSTHDILIIGTSALTSGKTLNIAAGSIIKLTNTRQFLSNGVLNVNGTLANPVTFTSINDASIGSEILGTGTPAAGNWSGILITGAGTTGSIIDHVIVRYAIDGITLTTNTVVRNSLVEYMSSNGVYFNSTTGPRLENSIVRNISSYGVYVYTGNATIDNNTIQNNSSYGIFTNLAASNPTITNNLVENNTNGIYLTAGSATISGNTIQNNSQYGINSYNLDVRLQGADVFTNNTITGNTKGPVISRSFNISGTSGTVDGSTKDILLTLSSGTVNLTSGKTLNIAAGSIIKTLNTSYLAPQQIIVNGVLNVNGTLANPVIFTSINDQSVGSELLGTGTPARGNWDGINISGAGTAGSIIDHVIVKYAVDGISLSTTNTIVRNSLIEEVSSNGVYFNSTTGPRLENSIVRNISSYGVYVYTGNATIDSNTIQNNSSYGIFTNLAASNPTITSNLIENNTNGIYLTAGSMTLSGNTIQNNSQYGINSYNLDVRLQGADVFTNNTITGNTKGPVISRSFNISGTSGTIDGSIHDILLTLNSGTVSLTSGKTLNIAAGTVIKTLITSYLEPQQIIVNGVLNVNGTLANPVIFTSINDQSVGSELLGTGTPARGNWDGISISGAGTVGSIIDHVIVRYAVDGINLATTNTIVRNSLIEEMSSNGVYFNSTTGPRLENSIVRNISSYGVYVYTGNATIDSNTIQNNSSYGIFTNLAASNPTITSNLIENNTNGIYLTAGSMTLSGNTIQNNSQYGINSYNLDVRLQGADVFTNNTITGNTKGPVISRSFNISGTTGTIDGSLHDILLTLNNGTVNLTSGKTLNITAGSVIKTLNTAYLELQKIIVNGVLNVNGTLAKPVIFTSINDQSVGSELLGTGTPARGNWDGISIGGAGTAGSVLNYLIVRYAIDGITLTTTNTIVRNSLIEEMSSNGIYLNSTTGPKIENSTVRNTSAQGIYIYAGTGEIYNTNIYSCSTGLYIRTGTPIIKNVIFKGNTGYGLNYIGGTPTIQYNLFFGNTTAPTNNYSLDGTNIVGLDPLFSVGTEYLTSGSPAINTGDPSFGNHPLSGNRYDIGRYEYTGYAPMVFTASVGSVSGRTLSYEWSFTQDPTNGTNPPTITNATGTISRDINVSCSFDVTKLGNYTLKLVIKDGAVIVGESTNSFTIVAP